MIKILASTMALLMTASMLTACGDSDSSSTASVADTTTTTTTPAESSSVADVSSEDSSEEESSVDDGTPKAESGSEYLYVVQASWTGKAPTDTVESTIKFTENTKAGACDLNAWDTGDTTFNGEWAQYIFTSDDMSNVTITFMVEADDDTKWESHAYDAEKTEEENTYRVFMVFGAIETIPNTTYPAPEGTDAEMISGTGKYVYTYDGAAIQAAIDDGKASIGANEDGTYTLGFNIQVGHLINGKVTGVVTGDNLLDDGDDTQAEVPVA